MSKTFSSSPPDSSVAPARARYEKLRPILGTRGPRHTTHLVHASLSLDERQRAERAFAEGGDCVIVSTSALELGIATASQR